MAEQKADQIVKKTFGTFQGVFTPAFLTILGVIMFQRAPWVTGNAGAVGAIVIVLLAASITLFTTFSMSSMTSNIKIGPGGAFSIISESLGLEVGGSVGLPLYFAQACAVAMYIFGFREGWLWMFPEHYPILVDFCTFLIVFLIAYISTDFAFKIQYVIMVVIVASLVVIFGALMNVTDYSGLELFGTYEGSKETGFKGGNFWMVFAVFFPAVTGIMAGANMSGDLTNPRRAIQVGTISAVLISTVVYIALVILAGVIATKEELLNNYNIFIDKALVPELVVAGLLGATFSSALSSFVGAPRILQALGENNILPKSGHFRKLDKKGEPRAAMWFTVGIILGALMLRDLNAIAPLLTMFFMITYAMLNVIVFIEQMIALPSFRPTFRIPLMVSFLGAAGCFFVMFIINAVVSLISIAFITAFYVYLLKRKIGFNRSDSRSGIFKSVAEWATVVSKGMQKEIEEKSWKPNLLVPISEPEEISGSYKLIFAITSPRGATKIIGITDKPRNPVLKRYMRDTVKSFEKANLISDASTIETNKFGQGVVIGMQALMAAYFKPNTILLTLREDKSKDSDFDLITKNTKKNNFGALVYSPYGTSSLGMEKNVTIWMPEDFNFENQSNAGRSDLAILIGIILVYNFQGNLNVLFRNKGKYPKEELLEKIESINQLVRFPKNTNFVVLEKEEVRRSEIPFSDLHIYPISPGVKMEELRTITKKQKVSCLFTIDSNHENAYV